MSPSEMDARLSALFPGNEALRDLFAGPDTEHKGAQVALRMACAALDRIAALEGRLAAIRAAGDALARHVAEDNRGQTARALVQAWEEAAR